MRVTNKEFLKRLDKVHGDSLRALSRYIGSKDKVTFECAECGDIFDASPMNVIHRGSGCPKCSVRRRSIRKRIPKGVFLDRLGRIHEGKYILTGEYIDSKTKTNFHCNVCGKDFEAAPSNILGQRFGCRNCKNKHVASLRQYSDEKFKSILRKEKPHLEVMGKISRCDEKVSVTCRLCGFTWKTAYATLRATKSNKCPACNPGGCVKWDTETLANDIQRITNGEFVLISAFKSAKVQIELFHNECETSFKILVNSFRKSLRCKICCMPVGEAKIARHLDEKGIDYIHQFRFEDNRMYAFDFAIVDENGAVCKLVEFQGEQHDKFVPFFHSDLSSYSHQQERDRIKAEIAKSKGIELIYLTSDIVENIQAAI